MKGKLISALVLISMILSGIAINVGQVSAQDLPDGVPSGAEPAKMLSYIDGDKFKVEVDGEEEEINLIGTDAPEVGDGDDDLGECYAKEASERIKELIEEDATLYLERDEENKDGKDRLLRYIWLEGKDGKKAFLLNTKLVREGFATFKSKDPNTKYDDNFSKAEDEAKDKKRGLWKTCGGGHVEVTPAPELGSADNPAPLGGTVSGDGREITLNNAYFVEGYDFLAPDPGNVYLTIEVSIVNDSESGKTHDYNELCFSAVDPDRGFKFDDTLLNPSGSPLGSGDLGPGDVVRGEVVLEVKADSQRIRVKYDTGCGIGGEDLYWIVTR
jgi:endonuclease YncB( thermonuclease family)